MTMTGGCFFARFEQRVAVPNIAAVWGRLVDLKRAARQNQTVKLAVPFQHVMLLKACPKRL